MATRHTTEPPWIRCPEVSDADRILDMVYVVARRTGRSPKASARLCTRLVSELATSTTLAVSAPGSRQAAARHVRVAVATALRVRSRRCDTKVFDDALAEAVARDELALLPPRQRFTVWSIAVSHRQVAEVVAQTGWTRSQVLRLLNAGLSTITRWGTKPV
ncbi:hypothetical protein M8542_48470 [Amycolatopsis sp. OK19-0408]|uniref:Uncharacterized protein n=1 Tax=Amycolatopsis iheyensis TaxID=2945988 RepID=A0A9X2SRS4_9PSEU|nr:hypothetical protein [Amycolatopsis iheyensis]MCR6490660.1 hypothetical protein [Amycolatopsis iheyensis]